MEVDQSRAEVKRAPRRRVLRIVVRVIAVIVVIALLINTIANYSANKEVQKELEALRAAGIPTTVEEVFGQEIPQERNAAPVYREAFEKIGDDVAEALRVLPRDSRDLRAMQEALPTARRALAENAEALTLLRRAVTFPDCRWNITITPPPGQTYFEGARPVFGGLRKSARLLTASAVVAMADGNFPQALQDFETAASLGNSLAAEGPLIAKLVQLVLVQQALSIFDMIVGNIELDAGDRTRLSRELARLAENIGMVQAMKAELVFGRALNEDMPKKWFIGRPILDRAEAHRLRYMRFVIDAGRKPIWQALDLLEARHREEYSGPSWKGVFGKMWAQSLSPVIIRSFETSGEALAKIEVRRAALARLAGEDGRILDPFTGKPLMFTETETGFKFWSVGRDKVDDGGNAMPGDEKPETPDDQGYDIVYEYREPNRTE